MFLCFREFIHCYNLVGTLIQEKMANSNTSREINDITDDVLEKIKQAGRQINVLIVGKAGAGKSTLITSLRRSMPFNTDQHSRKYISQPYTKKLERYSLITEEEDRELSGCSPVFFDMPGLPDEFMSTMLLLRNVLTGRIPVGYEMLDYRYRVRKEAAERGSFLSIDSNRIDRVVFVHPCTTAVPDELINAVNDICRELGK